MSHEVADRTYVYRGVTILRHGNFGLDAKGKECVSAEVLWTVVKDGRKGATFATKRQAQDAIDRNLDGRPVLSARAQEVLRKLRAEVDKAHA